MGQALSVMERNEGEGGAYPNDMLPSVTAVAWEWAARLARGELGWGGGRREGPEDIMALLEGLLYVCGKDGADTG